MQKFADFIIRRRKLIIISILLATLFFSAGLTRLTINSDFTSYLKPDDPAVQLFNRIGEEYGGNQIVMIAVKTDNVFTAPVLGFINGLTQRYSRLKEVSSVTSLTNIIDIKSSPLGIEVGKLIDPEAIPQSQKKLQELRNYVLSRSTYRGNVVSEDGTTTLIICRLDPQVNKIEAAKTIRTATESISSPYKIYYSGYPIQTQEMSHLLTNDLKVLIPIVVIVIVGVLYFSFKTGRGVLLPLAVVVVSTLWAMGLMGLTNTPLSLVSNVVPVILLAVGTAYGIHYISRSYEEELTEETKLEGIKRAVRDVGVPIILTGMTTITGFLSFIGVYITAIAEFGIFTAFGVCIAMLLSVSFLPAIQGCLKVPKKTIHNRKSHSFKNLMGKTAGFVLKKGKLILGVSCAIATAAIVIIPHIRTESQIINFFPPSSDIRMADQVIKNRFGGSIQLQVVVDGNLKRPLVLKQMRWMEKYLEQLPGVNNTQSLADLICRMNQVMNNRSVVPETNQEVANLLFMLEGEDILTQMVNKDYSEGIINATFASGEGSLLEHTVSSINRYVNTYINGRYVEINTTQLDPSQKESVQDWMYSTVSRLVYYDARTYSVSDGPEPEMLARTLKQLEAILEVVLKPEIKTNLRDDLRVYFEEESAVYITSSAYIEKVINELLHLAATRQVTEKNVTETLTSSIPRTYWAQQPEYLQITAEQVYARLSVAQELSRVQTLAEEIVQKFYPHLIHNQDFSKTVRDNLWFITEKQLSVPVEIVQGVSSKSEETEIKARVSGMITIINRLNQSLIKSQIQSIIIAIVVVFIFLSVQFRSIKIGMVALSPIVLVILLNFAIMGYGNIPLDYATMLAGSILIGVGIDYSIHFSSRFRMELGKIEQEKPALEKTLKTTGIAIIINALMVALGFFVLIAANMVPIKREGWMIGVLMLVSAFAALVFLPSLILVFKRKFVFNRTKK